MIGLRALAVLGVGVCGLVDGINGLEASLEARNTHVLHEKRSTPENEVWRRSIRVKPDAILPVRIGLTQNNLDDGYDKLMSVAHPDSPLYGQYLSADEVHDLFSPSDESISEVRNWLTASGINVTDIIHSENKGWFALDIQAAQAERLFLSEIHEYEHSETGSLRLGCDEYHVPHHLRDHIDYVTPGVKLSAPLRKRSFSGRAGRPNRFDRESFAQDTSSELSAATSSLPADVQHCGTSITPACWRALYGIPVGNVSDPSNSPGFYEQGDFYAQEDLDLYFAKFAPEIPNGSHPVAQFIDGATAPVGVHSPLNGGEADLDFQIAFALVYPTIPTLYQVDDRPTAVQELNKYNLFNTFLDALDGSYCNYTAFGITGDSWEDPKYPDPKKGGYKGKLQCGVYKPTRVISISYGEAERDIPENYQKRQCNEFMKLGLQGHTILEASGDYGVASFPNDGGKNGCLSSKQYGLNQTIFNPDQLSSCPYITSVGATALYSNQTVHDAESAALVYLHGSPFASTGGFSNYFKRPKYQEKAVSAYFKKHDPGYPTYVANANASNIGEHGGVYNRAGRGFPDVSANGAFMASFNNGTLGPEFGTSLSAPVWASVVTHLNQERSTAGKSPVGFINPTLYANAWALNDIKNGSNPGCKSEGFKAVEGWDPVTGLGTPSFPRLLKLFMSLP